MTVLIGIRVRSTPQHHGYIFRANFDRSLLQTVSGQHILTRISIQTAGLAFGGTGLCSNHVRGVGGSCAKHFICRILYGRRVAKIHTYYYYYYYYYYSITPHSFSPGLKPYFSANPSHRSLPFFFRTDHMIPQTVYFTSEHIRFYFLVFLFYIF